jgi:hypothetical protein
MTKSIDPLSDGWGPFEGKDAVSGSMAYAIPSNPVPAMGGSVLRREMSSSNDISVVNGRLAGSLSTTAHNAWTSRSGFPVRFAYARQRAWDRKAWSSSSHGAKDGVTKKTQKFCLRAFFFGSCWTKWSIWEGYVDISTMCAMAASLLTSTETDEGMTMPASRGRRRFAFSTGVGLR